MREFFKNHNFSLLLVFAAVLFYTAFGYDLQREDFLRLILLYAALFLVTWKLLQLEKTNFWFLAGCVIFFRVIFIGVLPNLSQDFYRFIWDGRMLLEGWNPYLYLPDYLIKQGSAPVVQAHILYEGMGALSAGNYTSYPPLNQWIFSLASLLGGSNLYGPVIVMRLVIIAADLGVLYFGRKLLIDLGLPSYRIFWYLLNPLVIIELTGNLHFEGVMCFFLVASIYLMQKQKWVGSAVTFAASVLLKLIPILFLPLFLKYFISKWNSYRKSFPILIGFYTIILGLVVLAFLPYFSSEFVSGFSSSIALWFQKFEFNAGIYYIVRWVGFQVKGYNIIGMAGKVLPVIIFLIVLSLAFFRKNKSLEQLITTMLLGITAYFFLSTTVHPWYLITPLLLSIFTKYKYMLVWSFLVILSYYTYSNTFFEENLLLIAIEYFVVFTVFLWELWKLEIFPAFNYKIKPKEKQRGIIRKD